MNVEGIFALLFVALLLVNSRSARKPNRRAFAWAPVALALIVALAFCRYLAFPFLADDYVHTANAHAFDWHAMVALFTVPASDRFFRPVGYLSYALDGLWAWAPWAWRTVNLALHILNTLLVYALCRKLDLPQLPAFLGALLFGIHGSRPEAVTWVAARFDLLAVLFGLICLLCMIRGWRFAACCAVLLATMSKESAFVVPLLAVAVCWYQRRPWRPTVPLFAVAAIVFAYRWWLLGGIGGYHDAANGAPTVFNFRLTSTLKALFPRFWATLLFPVNWTGALGTVLALCMVLGIGALAYLAWRGAERRPLLLGLLLATICSLPVHQFLSIGPDLEKSRVLYFASVGLAVMFAAARSRTAVCVFLLFQFAALEHNLEIWKRVGYLAKSVCDAGVTITGLPNVVDGVYFLHTGYPECMSRRSSDTRTYTWDAATQRIRTSVSDPTSLRKP